MPKRIKVINEDVEVHSQDADGEHMLLPLKSIDGNYCLSEWFYLQIFNELERCSSKDLGPLP